MAVNAALSAALQLQAERSREYAVGVFVLSDGSFVISAPQGGGSKHVDFHVNKATFPNGKPLPDDAKMATWVHTHPDGTDGPSNGDMNGTMPGYIIDASGNRWWFDPKTKTKKKLDPIKNPPYQPVAGPSQSTSISRASRIMSLQCHQA